MLLSLALSGSPTIFDHEWLGFPPRAAAQRLRARRRAWRQERRYQKTVRELMFLSPDQLRAHGIQPWQVHDLACKASRR